MRILAIGGTGTVGSPVAETAIRALDVPWTIVRPNYLFPNDAGMKEPLTENGVYPVPLGPTGIALTEEGHAGKTYNVNGPDLVSGPSASAIRVEALGKTVQYAGEGMDAFEAQARETAAEWTA